MRSELAALPPQVETIAEVRELYRAAEARAARMRLLSTTGRELAQTNAANVEAVLQRCAERLAFFLGHRSAELVLGGSGRGLAIAAPGRTEVPLGWIGIAGIGSLDDIAEPEDRNTSQMYLELMGATIDRIDRERERARLLAALTEREQRLEALVGRIFSAQEEERRRVSRELHDGVAQTATALVRMLEGASGDLDAAIPGVERTRLAGIARDLVTELRAVIGGLRPTLLDDLGLEAALQTLAEGLEAEGFTVRLALDRPPSRLPASLETALFRVAQEALTNVRKHAGCPCAVTIELLGGPDRVQPMLRICDSGGAVRVGASAAQPASEGSQVGIDGMQERMIAIGGRLEWRAEEGRGVTVTAFLPPLQ